MAPFDPRRDASDLPHPTGFSVRTHARTHVRMHARRDGGRQKKTHPGEEGKRRLLEEVFVLGSAEEAAPLVGVLLEMLSLREKRTTSKLAVFVPNCTYEGNCAAASVLCK